MKRTPTPRRRGITPVFLLLLLVGSGLSAQEFLNPLVVPPLIESSRTDYHIIATETAHNFNPFGTDSLNVPVRTFAFVDAQNPVANTILGPTIQWDYLSDLTPRVTNNLDERTTCHWHGAHVPQFADGGPHQIIEPGEAWNIAFPVLDKSATMWYHPHAMDLTYKHVQMGLSGMLYVEDPDDDPILSFIHDILPIEYGVDDIPLIVQTKKFERDANGQIAIQADRGFKDDYYYMVNGSVDPVLSVPADMIRLRLLDGDGKFSFNFGLTSDAAGTQPLNMQLIATDAGYTTRSFTLQRLIMSPGERNEVLVDLRGLEGETFYLYNFAEDLPAGFIGNPATTDNYAQNRALLRIDVGQSTQPPSPIIAFPINLFPSEQPSLDLVTNTRVKELRQDMFDVSPRPLFNIDSTLMDMMVVNDVVMLDSTEIWTIRNNTNIAHPWHIHDIHFWVTEILENGVPLDPSDYPEIFGGPKDNVLVRPNWELSYIATFDDYGTAIRFDSSYMYHCHILPHEDNGMMGQFVVWNGDTTTSVRPVDLPQREAKVYPNPSDGDVYLEGGSSRPSTVLVHNAAGQLLRILQIPPFDGAARLEVSGLGKGLLVLDWRSAEGRAVRRVITR